MPFSDYSLHLWFGSCAPGQQSPSNVCLFSDFSERMVFVHGELDRLLRQHLHILMSRMHFRSF